MQKRSRIGKNEVSGLGKLYLQGGDALKRDEMGLTGTEYAVFAKLAWFGLARREGEQRWSITQKGIDFIEGRTRVLSVAITSAREFVGLEGELVKAGDIHSDFYFAAA
ncbi:hypothetical protein ACFYXW_27495 [Streptomyces sp. NPDC001981]|uniref:hypothetical protein n=1 Tax=Streptomyces sp. NPDC001981 TaxID=3364628 RepID=UPI00368F039A